jgi:hypothetical protein
MEFRFFYAKKSVAIDGALMSEIGNMSVLIDFLKEFDRKKNILSVCYKIDNRMRGMMVNLTSLYIE